MTLIAYEFTSDASRSIGKMLRDNQSNLAFRNIISLIFNDKCLVYYAKRPFKNSFSFNNHTNCHYTNMEIRDRCDGTNKITTRG